VVTPASRQLDGATVLIVDDDVRNVFALTSALEMHGLNVLYADNGVDGVRLLAEHPEVDIVLMDAMMPDQDGYETTRGIRRNQRFQDLPVVFLTAKAMHGVRESALAAGATATLAPTTSPVAARAERILLSSTNVPFLSHHANGMLSRMCPSSVFAADYTGRACVNSACGVWKESDRLIRHVALRRGT